MKRIYFLATLLFGAVTFGAGLPEGTLIQPLAQQAADQQDMAEDTQLRELSARELAAQGYVSVDALKIRIDDGEVQWYDGVMWHTVATVEEMEKEDKFYVAQEAFQEFEEQLKQQQETEKAMQQSTGEQEQILLVGQKKDPKPAEKPKPTKPTVTAPVSDPAVIPMPIPDPTPQPVGGGDNGGGNSGGGDSGNSGGGNSGGGDSGNSGGGNSGGGDSGNSGGGDSGGGDSGNTGGGDSGSSGGTESGDGENMEWSDDYL